MASIAKLQTRILTRQSEPGAYKVYRAGLEWDLTDPIVVEGAGDFRSTPRWRDRLKPFDHQVKNLITFCRRLPVTLLADDVGLGKTISAGLVMSELMVRSRLSRTLIVCSRLLGPQWRQELEDKFGIRSEVATGRELLDADPGDGGAVITTYDSARLHLDSLPEDRFQMLVLDEAHKLRNLYGAPNPPQVARTFQKALEDRRFRFVLMLTATPIQNRLWDLYSLVDLLTTARGHENPFGLPGMFARRFIADVRDKARQLKPEARDGFRSIIHGYMSRTRRGDAKLAFPGRTVETQRVAPTPAELELIRTIARPIQSMNRLAQISVLKALSSSPEALLAQLVTMAWNRTAPDTLAAAVRDIVAAMPATAKLEELAALAGRLEAQNPEGWRLVVFTGLRETQTAIQNFLQQKGVTAGVINGVSGERNQDTIAGFRENPPRCRVIVSTEAGSEGVNLQAANVLVNFDLPWNPMIVEQRIGRVQRLGSDFPHVSVVNITLRDTFDDLVVGRLMEKLQTAANAIGDVESLLQGSEAAAGEEDTADLFEDRILKLVLDALGGKDVDEAVGLDAQRIEEARRTLEETNIDELLGPDGGAGAYVGPRAPKLPPVARSMAPRDFTLAALPLDGAAVTDEGRGVYSVLSSDLRERICFEARPGDERTFVLYAPHTPAFQRLVKRTIGSGVHDVTDADADPGRRSLSLATQWAGRMGATLRDARVTAVTRAFTGAALLRVRATVAHDSFERLVTCRCDPDTHRQTAEGPGNLDPVERIVRDPASLGIDTAKLREAGERDDAIAEFARFYEERREIEMAAAGDDARKRKKLSDDFTPNIDMVLAGLEGQVSRDVAVQVSYAWDDGDYESEIVVRPGEGRVVREPETERCAATGHLAPKECLGRCDVSGVRVLKHLLLASGFSDRAARPEFMERCELSGHHALPDEIETSAVTGRRVASRLLRPSAASGKRAEPEHFGICAFSATAVLKSELGTSDISGKPYRRDQAASSAVSGRTGHVQEFITCHETQQTIAHAEAEICEASGKAVRRGILATCAVTGQRVLPSLLATCEATGERVLKDRLAMSSVSNALLRPDKAVGSAAGRLCLPAEAETCRWSGRKVHPDDVRVCALTGLPIHAEFATPQSPPRLRPLAEMLDGVRHDREQTVMWDRVAQHLRRALKGGGCRIESAVLSPSRQRLAACAESRTLFGLRVRQVGAVYDVADGAIAGRVARGRRGSGGWAARE
jgi:superfamily II DNA or RNA helicase